MRILRQSRPKSLALKELSEACQQEGIRFCTYYAQRIDYEDPNSYSNYWDFHGIKRDYSKYWEGKAVPQVRELLTGYGPLGLVWFDDLTYKPQQAQQMVDLVRRLQPSCLVDSRISPFNTVELWGDYQVLGDHELPSGILQKYFETPQTLNHSWGYHKFDGNWKSPREVVHQLVTVVSRGGNYLLDVGATGEGTFPQAAVDILEKVGEWVRLNGESIYGTSASPFEQLPWGQCTVTGEKLYLHVFEWPEDGELSLTGLKNEVKKAYLLLDSSRALKFRREQGRVSVRLPGPSYKAVDEYDRVVVLEIAGEPEVSPPVVVQRGSSPIKLEYMTDVTEGKAMRRHGLLAGYHISRWEGPQDSATWRIRISEPRRYQVWITFAAPKECVGGEYRVMVGSASLQATVFNTVSPGWCSYVHPFQEQFCYQTTNIGFVDLAEAGEYELTIRPASNVGHNLMYLRSIELLPEETPVPLT